jgi:hypothetical protein
VSPLEAAAVEIEEPDWRERFETHCARWPKLPRYLQEDAAFEATMKDWRRFHFSWVEGPDGKPKQIPAPAADAIIALADLRIFPPRFTIKDVPRDGVCGYQCDDHMWVGPWRIVAIEDRTLCMEKYMEIEGKPETRQIDLNKADWSKYTNNAVEALRARSEHERGTQGLDGNGGGGLGRGAD